MRNSALTKCLIGLIAAASLGCIQHDGQLAIFLTGATAAGGTATVAAQQVNLEITSIEVQEAESGAFLTLSAGSQIYELLGLGGKSSLLAIANKLEEGNYSQIRFGLSESNSSVVNAAGRRDPLKVEPTTLSVPALFTVVEDKSLNVTLEIDVAASLTQKANGAWVLRPVIRQAGATTAGS